MDETQTPPRKTQQNSRSVASNNWRLPDATPRQEPQQRSTRGGRSGDQRNSPRGPGSPATESTPPGSRLYVGNLLYTAQPNDVEQLFIENGFTIVNTVMSIDPFTGRNPSYCFVDLESPEEATRAMNQLNGSDVLGRAVRINPGVSKKSGGDATPQSRIRSYDDRGSGSGNWGTNDRGSPSDTPQSSSNSNYKSTLDRWPRNDASDNLQGAQAQGKRLYVGGLPQIEPQAAVDSEMQKLFEGFELTAVSKIISPHPSKAEEPGNHHYLFVDMPTAEDASDAIQKLDGMESPWGGELRIGKAKDNRDKKAGREQFGGGNVERPEGRAGGGGSWRK